MFTQQIIVEYLGTNFVGWQIHHNIHNYSNLVYMVDTDLHLVVEIYKQKGLRTPSKYLKQKLEITIVNLILIFEVKTE